MSLPLILSLRNNVSFIEQSTEEAVLKSPLIELKIQELSPGLITAFKILTANGATEEDLSDLVLKSDGTVALSKFYYYLHKLSDLCLICHTLPLGESPLATIVPLSRYYKFNYLKVDLSQKYVLSRFAYSRKYKEQMVMESPLSYAQIILWDWRIAGLINALAKPQDCQELSSKIPGIPEEIVKLFLSLLFSNKLLSEVTPDGDIQEEKSEQLNHWSFHNLLFHSRSRLGRHIRYYKSPNPSLEQNPLPVVKPKMSNIIIDLYRPDIEKLKASDYPFTLIVENRKSTKNYLSQAINSQQIGEFLYRSARVRELYKINNQEVSNRPYPNGGANYELEIYVVINQCETILPGLYHYCPKNHQLCQISNINTAVQKLLKGAAEATRQDEGNLQVLIIIAARFQKLGQKYDGVAYATTLKHVGVLYQNMYLVATAMNLAACAVGFGDSDLFASAVGTDYYVETSVGEFILGASSS